MKNLTLFLFILILISECSLKPKELVHYEHIYTEIAGVKDHELLEITDVYWLFKTGAVSTLSVTGKAINIDSVKFERVTIYASIYNNLDELISTYSDYVDSFSLEAGEQSNWEIFVSGSAQQPVRVTVGYSYYFLK